MTKRIYVIRHGQTYLNRYHKMQGWSDSPLTPEGIKGAEDVAEVLKDVPFDLALSSDAKRASDTAQIIVNKNVNRDDLQLMTSKYFREALYGFYEAADSGEVWFATGAPHGVPTFKQLVKKYTLDDAKNFMKAADPFHDAENADEYWHRVNKGLKMISEFEGLDNILLVTHGTTIRSLVERFGQGKFDIGVGPKNSSITIFENKDQDFKVLSYDKLTL